MLQILNASTTLIVEGEEYSMRHRDMLRLVASGRVRPSTKGWIPAPGHHIHRVPHFGNVYIFGADGIAKLQLVPIDPEAVNSSFRLDAANRFAVIDDGNHPSPGGFYLVGPLCLVKDRPEWPTIRAFSAAKYGSISAVEQHLTNTIGSNWRRLTPGHMELLFPSIAPPVV